MVYEKFSDKWFLDLYLKYGSVEEVLRSHENSLPISEAHFHRLVKKHGIIKSAGRHASLAEVLHFFAEKAIDPKVPLERLYYEAMPTSFRTSVQTLHRIYRRIERKAIGRFATAVVVTQENTPDEILIVDELSGSRVHGKKVGDASVLMGFSKKGEPRPRSILRILQQEMSTELALEGKLIAPDNPQEFMSLRLLDVGVRAHHIEIPRELCQYFSSHRVTNHRFVDLSEISRLKLRSGVSEIITGYAEYKNSEAKNYTPSFQPSLLNQALAV